MGGDDQQNAPTGHSKAGKSSPHASSNRDDRDDQKQSACDRSQEEPELGEPDSRVTRKAEQEHGGQFASSSGRHPGAFPRAHTAD